MITSILIGLPEMILGFGAVALLMVAAFGGDRSAPLVSSLAVALLVAAAAFALVPVTGFGTGFNGLYRADAFAAFVKPWMFGATAICIIVAPRFFNAGLGLVPVYNPGQDRTDDTRVRMRAYDGSMRAEYPVIILLSAAGAGIMVSAVDLLTLYIGLELQSLASYVLASFMRRDTRSAEAGLKYFVLGALASGILLYGVSLVYGFTGTTSYAGIGQAFAAGLTVGQVFGLVFVFAGVAFKIAAVPFHMWTPDVYEGAPTPVTALFATAQKIAAVAMLLRIAMGAMEPAVLEWRQIVIFAGLASIVLGAAGAIGQNNFKRLLAYSSINNIGFALLGLGAGTQAGVQAMLTYMAIYVVMTLGSFLCVLQLGDADGRPIERIDALSGLSQRRPGLALAIAIFMFSLAGIPPLFGFWAKFVVFDALVLAGLWPLAAIGIAASVIGAFYYLKIVKTMYFDAPSEERLARPDRLEGALIAVCAGFIVIGYLFIPWLDRATAIASRGLL